VVVVSAASDEFRLRDSVLLSFGLAVVASLIFKVILNNPIDIFPPFLTR